ncbi:MAG TPA: extracellular solute-binding protein [Blastocatellia bacterium]|nr:extracellular solute-binding protein [Blastocatellia bacterium]
MTARDAAAHAAAGAPASRGAMALVAVVFAYLYVPILILVAFSFNDSRQMSVWHGFTWSWYQKAWQNEAVIQSLRTSMLVAFLATAVSLVLGTPAALALGRHRFRGKGLADALFYLPVVIPEIVLGFASVVFFGLVGWQLGFASVVVAHIAFSISYVVFVVRARLSMLSPSLEEAALDLGATPFEAFRRVTLPLLAPGLVSSALLVFTISLDDYVVTSFVAGRGGTTLPLQIYSMVRTGVTPEINVISTFLLVATFVLVFVSQRLQTERIGRGATAAAVAVVLALGVFAIGDPAQSRTRRELSIYIWSNYLTDKMIKDFEERYNVRVHVELFDSNEALLAKLQTGVTSYDIVAPSDYMVGILARAGLLHEIDKRELENFDNLSPRFTGLAYDPENRYSVPYTWGTSGIGYRRDKTGRDLKDWADMWDPAYRDRIGMLNDARENFAAALKRMGRSINTTDAADVAQAAALLDQQKPLVRTFDSDTFADNLLSGEVWAAQGYNGQIAKAGRADPNIVYVIPEEGCTMFIDNLAIPKDAPNADLAMRFIDYILEGQVAAQITEVTGYATPNTAATPYLPPELRDDPAIFPPEKMLDKCELMRDLGPVTELYDRYWTKIKS